MVNEVVHLSVAVHRACNFKVNEMVKNIEVECEFVP